MKIKLIVLAVGMMLTGSAIATDYQVALSEDSKGTINEYAASATGINLFGSYGPANPIYNGMPYPNSTAGVGASTLVTSPDASVVFALYQPYDAFAVIVEYAVSNHGVYERYRADTWYRGGGIHNIGFQSFSVGPHNSLTVLEQLPSGPGGNRVVFYDNEMRELGGADATSLSTHIVAARVDVSGILFYVCQDDGNLIANEFTAGSNVLTYTQPTYPVPYKRVYVTADPGKYAAFCQ